MARWSTVVSGAAGCLALVLLVLYGGGAGDPTLLSLRQLPANPPVLSAPLTPPPASDTTHALATSTQHAPPTGPPAGSLVVPGHTSPHPELCPKLGHRLRLVMVVMSAPANAEARAGIRLTWGHYAARADVTLAFLVGLTSDPRVAAALLAEDAMYGDVVQGQFVDSYSNLTLKTLSMLEWVSAYCPRARHVLKTDDDMFINMPLLLQFGEEHANESRTVFGSVVEHYAPIRNVTSKYYVPRLEYAPDVYPKFMTGPAYLLTADCIRPMYERALLTTFLRLEDVFLTGVVLDKLGLKKVDIIEFFHFIPPVHPCMLRQTFTLHEVTYDQQFELWQEVLSGKTNCDGDVYDSTSEKRKPPWSLS